MITTNGLGSSMRPITHKTLGIILALGMFALAACSTATPAPTSTPTVLLTPTATLLPTNTIIPSPMPGGLYVDPSQAMGAVSPLVYGTNYGPWLFVPLEMQPKVKDAGLKIIRFPGGNWGDQNDIDNYNLDQFVAYAKQWGAEPMINVRLEDSTPEVAAELVKYVNVTQGYKVRYWAIGNEPNYFYDGKYTTAAFNQDWRKWAIAMRAVDPTIQLVGPETDRYFLDPTRRPKDVNGLDWMTEFLKANGDMVNVVSFHLYPFPPDSSSPPPTIAELRKNTSSWDDIIRALRQDIRTNAGRDIPVAITEINSSWAANTGGEGTMDSHYNAIWWADVLGRLIRQKVEIVTQFAIIGEYGLMGKYDLYPIYYTYKMYQQFGTQLVYASSDDPDVSVYAAKRADGSLTVMVVNLASASKTKQLKLAGVSAKTTAPTWLFDAKHKAESVDPTELGADTSVTVPPESITVYVLPAS
jgi:hypothetical protein